MNKLFDEILDALHEMKKNGISDQERKMLEAYAKAIRRCSEKGEEINSLFLSANKELNKGGCTVGLMEANRRLAKAINQTQGRFEILYSQIIRLINS